MRLRDVSDREGQQGHPPCVVLLRCLGNCPISFFFFFLRRAWEMWCIPLGDGVTLKHLSLQIFSWKRSKEWLTSGTCLHLTWFTQTHIYLYTDKNKHPNTHTYCIQMACAHTITDTLMSSSTELQSPTAEVHVMYLLTQIAPDSSIDPALFFFL